MRRDNSASARLHNLAPSLVWSRKGAGAAQAGCPVSKLLLFRVFKAFMRKVFRLSCAYRLLFVFSLSMVVVLMFVMVFLKEMRCDGDLRLVRRDAP